MDNLGLMVLTVVAVFGFFDLATRARAAFVLRILSWPAMAVLIFYFVLLWTRVTPEWITGNAQAGYLTTGLLALGFVAVLSRPKSSDRGKLSA